MIPVSKPLSITKIARPIFAVTMVIVVGLALLPAAPELSIHDKAGHMLAFFVLAALALIGWPRNLHRVVVGLIFLGGAIELLQGTAWIHRDCDFYDWLADIIGVGTGVASAWPLTLPHRKDSAE